MISLWLLSMVTLFFSRWSGYETSDGCNNRHRFSKFLRLIRWFGIDDIHLVSFVYLNRKTRFCISGVASEASKSTILYSDSRVRL